LAVFGETDLKALLAALIEHEVELKHNARSAKTAVTGESN
jgi:hypothetical protein